MSININYIKNIKYILVFVTVVVMAIVITNRLLSYRIDNEKHDDIVQEGFTTYFRQTVRPHVRRIGYAKELVSHHVNEQFGNFIKRIGLF
jgi:hypothetical protein